MGYCLEDPHEYLMKLDFLEIGKIFGLRYIRNTSSALRLLKNIEILKVRSWLVA